MARGYLVHGPGGFYAIRLRFTKEYAGIVRLRERLKDLSWEQNRLMKGIGNILVATAQKAFKEQRLGDINWPARYPKQTAPVINIAGVLQDFLEGKREPPPRRFQNRPAGRDRDLLLRSLTPGKAVKPHGNIVDIVVPGSVVPYALAVQEGGKKYPSEQKVTQSAKYLLRAWLVRLRKRRDKATKEGGIYKKIKGQRQKIGEAVDASFNYKAAQKCAFLLHRDSLVTKQAARPYLGVTDEAEREIMDLIYRTFGDAGSSTGVRLMRK